MVKLFTDTGRNVLPLIGDQLLQTIDYVIQ